MQLRDLLDFSQIADRRTLETRLIAHAEELGFDRVSAAIANTDQGCGAPAFDSVGYTPPAFLANYLSIQDARRDPVMRRLKTATAPFVYDQTMYVACDAADVWETQAEFGYKTGVALALRLPVGRHFLFGVDRDRPLSADQTQLTRTLADISLLASFCLDAALRCLDQCDTDRPTPEITLREAEVLKWTLEGKSSWVVGKIIGISDSTVNFHLRNAMRKLGVSSKHVAATKAASLGLI